jgi:signal transduction histidine kinase
MLINPVKILFTANDFIDSAWNDKFQLNIFRIIQEQLNNILKHAHAKKIYISIRECENDILVEISDDGIGFVTTKRTTGVGLTNIKSRSELFNGTLVLTSEPGKGTSLSITFHKTELTQKNMAKAYKLN